MKFNKVFIEKNVAELPIVNSILAHLPETQQVEIERYDDFFGVVRKPYLEKRHDLNLFLAEKTGAVIRSTPAAYGESNGQHFYFTHSYNCIFECEYCYLQNSFKSPDIVLFVNHDYIIREIESTIAKFPNEKTWFHAGEYSDSLALSSLSKEWGKYIEFFRGQENSVLELRTKSIMISSLLEYKPHSNVIVSFSISPDTISEKIDRRTPPLKARIKAMKKLMNHGYKIGLHLDPIVFDEQLSEKYQKLAEIIKENLGTDFSYISFGVVRFPSHLYREVSKNYPDSVIHSQPFIKAKDGMRRYPLAIRNRMLSSAERAFSQTGFKPEIFYRCMES